MNFEALARHGVIQREDLALFQIVDTPAAALEALKRGLAMGMDAATPAIAPSVTSARGGPASRGPR